MKALNAAKILACLTLSYLCVVASIVVWRAGNAFDSNLAKWGDSGAQTFAGLNAPCTPVKGTVYTVDHPVPCGTLADMNRTLATVRGTFGQIEAAANHENKNLTTLDSQELALFTDLHLTAQAAARTADSLSGTATALTGTATAATATLSEGKRTIAAFQPVLAGLTEATGSINEFLKGQMLTKTLPEIAVNLDKGIVTGDAIAADVYVAAHPLLNPDPCKTAKCRLRRYVWPAIRVGLGLGSDFSGWERAAGKAVPVKVQ
jgi:hypothetical protein